MPDPVAIITIRLSKVAMRIALQAGMPRTHSCLGGACITSLVQSPAYMIREDPGTNVLELPFDVSMGLVANECHSRSGRIDNRTKVPLTGMV